MSMEELCAALNEVLDEILDIDQEYADDLNKISNSEVVITWTKNNYPKILEKRGLTINPKQD